MPQAPVFVTGLPPEIIVSPNDKLVLTTEVRAAPPAEIRWDVDGVDVQRSKQYNVLNEHNRSTLVVHPPVAGGRYNVTCANEVGKASFQVGISLCRRSYPWQRHLQGCPLGLLRVKKRPFSSLLPGSNNERFTLFALC